MPKEIFFFARCCRQRGSTPPPRLDVVTTHHLSLWNFPNWGKGVFLPTFVTGLFYNAGGGGRNMRSACVFRFLKCTFHFLAKQRIFHIFCAYFFASYWGCFEFSTIFSHLFSFWAILGLFWGGFGPFRAIRRSCGPFLSILDHYWHLSGGQVNCSLGHLSLFSSQNHQNDLKYSENGSKWS